MNLTQELVRELFDYKNGFLYWKVKPKYSHINIKKEAGHIFITRGEHRRSIKIDNKQYLASRLIFLWHNGYLPEMVDHENINTLDDRIENLRAANKFNNAKNTVSRKNSTSKYLGVHLKKDGNYIRWASDIYSDGKKKYLGVFKSEKDAALAYNRAAVMYHREFANLNIIKPLPVVLEKSVVPAVVMVAD